MPSLNRRPTSEELEELAAEFERDPGGEAASKLSLAYLALGRPREALDVGAKALRFRPENLEARALVGEAFAALHQWDRAKDELLKVVKVDRRQWRAARLLGEVLMRREDFQRALPVLQHAAQLKPNDGEVADLLERARAGKPPDPPPAIPSPVAPAPSKAARRPDPFGEEPTRQVGTEEAAQIGAGGSASASGESGPSEAPSRAGSSASGAGSAPAKGAGSGAGQAGGAPSPASGTLFGAPPAAVSAPSAPRAGQGGGVAGEPGPAAGTAAPEPALARSGEAGGASRESGSAPPGSEGEASAPSGQGAPAEGGEAALAGGAGASAPPGDPAGDAPASGREEGGAEARDGAQGAPQPEAPGPGNAPAVRPRVFVDDKPVEAAQGGLKQAASVGEQYLNHLLTGGLLRVPNVGEPDVPLRVVPTKPWRKSWRMVGYLLAFGVLGAVAAGGWNAYSERQRAADLERHTAEVSRLLPSGTHAAVSAALAEAETAMERSPDSPEAMAAFVEAGGVAALLYGEVERDDVLLAASRAEPDVEEGTAAARSLAIGRAAVAIAPGEAGERGEGPALDDAYAELQELLEADEDDSLAQWLAGEAKRAAGQRAEAEEAFERAYDGGDGAEIAAVSLADAALDEGAFERANQLYGELLAREADDVADGGGAVAPEEGGGEGGENGADASAGTDADGEADHDLALLGQVLAKAERSVDEPTGQAAEALQVLSVELRDRGRRVEAYKRLAGAKARLLLQDFDAMREALDDAEAAEIREARFLARIALGRAAEGDIGAALDVRESIPAPRSLGEGEPDVHPLVEIVDAELLLAQGLPSRAVEMLDGRSDLRARRILGRAYFDLGAFEEAKEELGAALEIAPTDLRAEVYERAATIATSSGAELEEADDELRRIARGARSRGIHYARGAGLRAAGEERDARRAVEASLDRLSSESPNPVAYKAHTALAELALGEGDGPGAIDHLDAALDHNATYLPAHELRGAILAEAGDWEAALEHLEPVVGEGAASADGELAFARAALESDAGERQEAVLEALARAAEKGAEDDAIEAVAESADAPALEDALEL